MSMADLKATRRGVPAGGGILDEELEGDSGGGLLEAELVGEGDPSGGCW